MPWVYAPKFLMLRTRKDERNRYTGGEIIGIFGTSSPRSAAKVFQEAIWLRESEARRENVPASSDYELYRLTKGGSSTGREDIDVLHPHGFDITPEGNLHFWCLPYHPIYHVDIIEDDVPLAVVEHGAGAVEHYVRQRAEAAIAASANTKTISESQFRIVHDVFKALQARR